LVFMFHLVRGIEIIPVWPQCPRLEDRRVSCLTRPLENQAALLGCLHGLVALAVAPLIAVCAPNRAEPLDAALLRSRADHRAIFRNRCDRRHATEVLPFASFFISVLKHL
jgi:hypothetical protein